MLPSFSTLPATPYLDVRKLWRLVSSIESVLPGIKSKEMISYLHSRQPVTFSLQTLIKLRRISCVFGSRAVRRSNWPSAVRKRLTESCNVFKAESTAAWASEFCIHKRGTSPMILPVDYRCMKARSAFREQNWWNLNNVTRTDHFLFHR